MIKKKLRLPYLFRSIENLTALSVSVSNWVNYVNSMAWWWTSIWGFSNVQFFNSFFFSFEDFEFYNPVSCVEEFNKDLEVFKAIPKQLWILEFWLFCIFCRWTLNKTSLMTDTPFYLNVFHWILARMIKFLLLSSPRSLNHRKPSISLWNSDRKWLFCKIFNCKLWVVNSIIKIG